MNESKLTYAQIEKLQYILDKHMFNTCTTHNEENIALKNKLIAMRARLEYFSINIKDEEVINTI